MNVTKRYYSIPFIFGIFPNIIFAITGILVLIGSILNLDFLAIPFMIGLYVNMFYCFPTGLLLHLLGIDIYINQSGAMIAFVTWTGMIVNMIVWFGIGLILNFILRIKLKYDTGCSNCGFKITSNLLRCGKCGASLVQRI